MKKFEEFHINEGTNESKKREVNLALEFAIKKVKEAKKLIDSLEDND
jgi:hypothetical protein